LLSSGAIECEDRSEWKRIRGDFCWFGGEPEEHVCV